MSLLYKTDIHQNLNETADRKHAEYGFVVALVCMALALVVASILFTPAPISGGIRNNISIVGP